MPTPVYNLATLEYDAGDLAEARALVERYLELDTDSRLGAARAARGIALRRPACCTRQRRG